MAPEYPKPAREAGVQGTVVVAALVCRDGQVLDTRILKSVPMLDQAASDAVRQWRFRPALRDGMPVATWIEVPIRFRPY